MQGEAELFKTKLPLLSQQITTWTYTDLQIPGPSAAKRNVVLLDKKRASKEDCFCTPAT